MFLTPFDPPLKRPLRSPLQARVGGGLRVLDFATLTASQLQSRFGWVRSGAGTLTDSGGAVRYGAHNLLQPSENLNGSGWTRRGSFTAGAVETRSGVPCQLVAIGTSGNDAFRGAVAVGAGASCTPSFWVEPVTTSGTLRIDNPENSANGRWEVNLSMLGAGMQRITEAHPAVAVINAFSGVAGSGNSGVFVYMLSGSAGLYIGRVQLNLGPVALDYVPTTTSPIYLMRSPDYTHGVPGLLLEGARTNLAPNTEDFTQAAWLKQLLSVSASGTASPSGGACQILTPSGSDAAITMVNTPAAASAMSFSVWLRSRTGGDVSLTLRASRDVPFASVSSQVITVTTGWQRFTLTATPLDTTQHSWRIGGGSTWSTGENLDASGAQLEAGAYPTSDIPNPTTGTMLRVADVAEIGPGAEFDALRPAGQGTIVFEWVDRGATNCDLLVFHLAGSTNESLCFCMQTGSVFCIAMAGGVVQLYADLGPPIARSLNKAAISYGLSGLRALLNGGAESVNAAAVIPAPSHARFIGGALFVAGTQAYKLVAARALTTQRTGAALQALTV